MPSLYFEDFASGQKNAYGPFRLSKDLLIGFSHQYDPLPFHLDEEAAKKTFAGRLTASGWQSCSILMRIIADGFMNESSSCGSPGIDEVKWLKPLLPGDVLSVRSEVLEVKASKSKPEIGFVKFYLELVNQNDEVTSTQTAWVIFGRKGAIIAPLTPPSPKPHAPMRHAPIGNEIPPLGFLEDQPVNKEIVLGTHTFTEEEIISFAHIYDPQPFHIDRDMAKASFLGGLCASGWHTGAWWMRFQADYWSKQTARSASRGEDIPRIGPSPGFKNLKWLKPVYAGDSITYAATVTAWRKSTTRPEWGLVYSRNTGVNQYGEPVFEFDGTMIWQSRPKGED